MSRLHTHPFIGQQSTKLLMNQSSTSVCSHCQQHDQPLFNNTQQVPTKDGLFSWVKLQAWFGFSYISNLIYKIIPVQLSLCAICLDLFTGNLLHSYNLKSRSETTPSVFCSWSKKRVFKVTFCNAYHKKYSHYSAQQYVVQVITFVKTELVNKWKKKTTTPM